MPRHSQGVNATGWTTAKTKDTNIASRPATSRMVTSAKNGGGMWPKCGTCRQGSPYLYVSTAGPFAVAKGLSGRQKLPALTLSTKRESERLKRLTARRARDYIAALGRTAALARWRVRETLTVYAVNHPAIALAMTDVGCRRLRFRLELSETGFFDGISPVPGCLTGESEERETWTAESLRAASSNGEASAFFRKRGGHWKRLGGLRSKVTLLKFAGRKLRG